MLISARTFSDSFPIVPLSKVVDFLDNLRKPVTASDRTAGEYPYYGANGLQGTINDYIFDEPLILLAEDGGFFGMPDKTIAYQVSGKCWVNNHAHVLRPKQGVDIRYLLNVLQKYDVTPYTNGTTRAKLTKGSAERIPIPLPPLDEQKRIAGILDKADAIRRKRAESLKLLDELLRATFLDMFGDPLSGKGKYETVTLEKCCKKVTDGTHQSPQFVDSGIPFLVISNITSGEISFETKRFVTAETYRELTKSTAVEIGDILYSTVGSYGIPVLVDTDRKFIFQRHIGHIKPDQSKILAKFLHAQMQTPFIRFQADKAARGVAQKTLNLSDIKKFEVMLPPIEQQKKFIGRYEKLNALKIKSGQSTSESDTLFHSLVARAFKGEL